MNVFLFHGNTLVKDYMLWNNVTTKKVKIGLDVASLQNYVKQKHTFIFR